MSRFLKEAYKNLVPYVPGEQPRDFSSYIKLNTNESPFPPSPKATACLTEEEGEKLRLYSDPESKAATEAIADYYGLKAENVLVTNGSDEALEFVFGAFFDEKREVCFPDITYGFYPSCCRFFGLKINEVPLKEDFTVDVEALVNTDKNVVIANPNAPTGIALSIADIKRILDANRERLVVVDEAYVDFGAYSCVSLINDYENLIVVQTFSKSRSLAGARLGIILSNEQIVRDLNSVKYSFNPYNVGRLASLVGTEAIKDADYFNYCRAEIMKNRAVCARELKKMGFQVLDSSANFLFARHEKVGGEFLYRELKKRGVLVRHFDKPRIEDFIRITIGTAEQMRAFLAAVKEIIGG